MLADIVFMILVVAVVAYTFYELCLAIAGWVAVSQGVQ